MAPTIKRTDDVVIVRRAGEDTSRGGLIEFFAVTYPGHDDVGHECHTRAEAEAKAARLAEARGVSVWYGHDSSNRADLVVTFRR